MFIREKITPTGRTLQLVESYRNQEGRPRQRNLVSLGDAAIPKAIRPAIAKAVKDYIAGQQSLLPATTQPGVAEWVNLIIQRLELKSMTTKEPNNTTQDAEVPEQTLTQRPEPATELSKQDATSLVSILAGDNLLKNVCIDSVEHRDHAVLGPLLAGLHVWNTLGMQGFLAEIGFNPTEQHLAAIEVLNRLVDPVSENALPSWFRRSALPELLGATSLPTFRDRFYRSCDKLLKHKEEILSHLRRREKEHFGLNSTILLYDLTNTYFEGQMLRNPKAKRGKSKEKRDDCPQVVVGMVFDSEGFEMGHEVFEGNRNDGKSLVDMVKHLQNAVAKDDGLFERKRPLVIVDGGIASLANRKLFLKEGFDFLANESRPGRKKYLQWFQEDTEFSLISHREGQSSVLVRCIRDPLAPNPDHADTLVLCKSEGRLQKEEAIFSRAEQRFCEAIQKLRKRLEKGGIKKRECLERAIGKVISKNPRVAGYYHTEVVEVDGGKLLLRCQRNRDKYDEAGELRGCYVLRTSATFELDAEAIWNLYMTLTHAEEGFRTLKSDVGLRPIRHHREDRGDSHIFISVLAYHLLHWITYTLGKKGDTRNWSTLRRILSTHGYATISMKTDSGQVCRIRKAGIPDLEQEEIYRGLGVCWKGLPSSTTIA